MVQIHEQPVSTPLRHSPLLLVLEGFGDLGVNSDAINGEGPGLRQQVHQTGHLLHKVQFVLGHKEALDLKPSFCVEPLPKQANTCSVSTRVCYSSRKCSMHNSPILHASALRIHHELHEIFFGQLTLTNLLQKKINSKLWQPFHCRINKRNKSSI